MRRPTPRQIEFLVLAANGKQRSEIAKVCGVAETTVARTMKDARENLEARTIGQAIIRAISYEVIRVDKHGTAHAA